MSRYLDQAEEKLAALRQEGHALVLGIETSCDETAASVVEDGRHVLSSVIDSQVMEHRRFGGVVPEIAARAHLESVDDVVDQALSEAGMTLSDIDAIAVTKGPGLVGALLAGVSCAKALAFARELPLVGVHHIKGHIAAAYLQDASWQPPFLALVVSGGHSHIGLVDAYDAVRWLGQTRDDSAGEAFDKVARVLGLPYPGGPAVDALAKDGDPKAIRFPRAKVRGAPLDFSFSGLKTAVLQHVQKLSEAQLMEQRADIAASFQQAVVDVLVGHTMEAARHAGMEKIAVVGGVACNSRLRADMAAAAEGEGLALCIPDAIWCTDNAAMIGCAGHYALLSGRLDDMTLNASAVIPIREDAPQIKC